MQNSHPRVTGRDARCAENAVSSDALFTALSGTRGSGHRQAQERLTVEFDDLSVLHRDCDDVLSPTPLLLVSTTYWFRLSSPILRAIITFMISLVPA